MSKFTKLSNWYKPAQTKGKYETTEVVEWEVGMLGSDLWLRVPVGTVFDVSVPSLFTWVVNPNNPIYFKAASMHDHALNIGWDRVSAAAAFSNGLAASGVGTWARFVLVVCVIAWKWK